MMTRTARWVVACTVAVLAAVGGIAATASASPPTRAGAAPPDGGARLRVTTSPVLPSQITVDGHVADTWGLNWLKIPAGSHQVCFRRVQGYRTPNCETVDLVDGQTTTVVGEFVGQAYLHVTTSPAVPSRISIDGTPRDNWGVYTDLPVGTHQVCFGSTAGYTPPACQTVDLVAGTTSTVTGTFAPSSGEALGDVGYLRVTTSPAVASQITVDGNITDTWGLNWLELPPGSHTVCFGDVAGFTTPACQVATLSAGATSTVEGVFPQHAAIRVFTSPAVAGTIYVDGVPSDDWGLSSDFPAGDHEVCFGPVPGKVAPDCSHVSPNAGWFSIVTGTYTDPPA